MTFGSYPRSEGSIPSGATIYINKEVLKLKRNYDFKKNAKEKEQKRRKEIHSRHYFPTMPQKGVGRNGEEFFLQGSPDRSKKVLKKTAKKAARRAKEIPSGSGYKKSFDLWWSWF